MRAAAPDHPGGVRFSALGARAQALLLLVLVAVVAPVSAQPPPSGSEETVQPEVVLPPVRVIGSTPLPALGVPADRYPGNVQSLTAEDLEQRGGADLSDILFRRLGSVNITSGQGNPWQNDLTYRGFLASPLAGSPIGLSVYLDGMRFNNGFGDTVSWDLIPRLAIADIDVIPGSNPIFGLNTLGGALAVRTKTGRDFSGSMLGVSGGSFGRRGLEAEHGGSRGALDWYLTFNALEENGWRAHSPSELIQLFTNLGWEATGTSLRLNYLYANNDLTGNGLVPASILARDRSAVYTFPDQTRDTMHLGHLRGSHQLTDQLLVSGNVFYRDYRSHTLNGDAEVTCVDTPSGEEVFDAAGRLLHVGRCSGSSAGLFDAAGTPLAGTLQRQAEGEDRTTDTRTQDWGVTMQLSSRAKIVGRDNRLTAGVAYDGHASRFSQRQADAELVPRNDGVGTVRTSAFTTAVDVDTRQDNVGVYLTDTFDVTRWLALTLAGRYQRVNITIRDRSGLNPALDGDHHFSRFSPAVGLTVRALEDLTLFASYNEGFRAPTPAELTCADENAPCRLPGAFVADPPLRPVVARTWELGARGRLPRAGGLAWNVALFRTDLEDDILFTVVQAGGSGFFQNVGGTRRQGAELGLSGGWRRLTYFASYAYVLATYQSTETLASVTEASGVTVHPGDRIPGIPEHALKIGAELEVLDRFWVGGEVMAISSSFLRGDDGNRRAPTDGYALLNLHTRYQPTKSLEFWARLDNATNTDYLTTGSFNFNAFSTPIAVERFGAPGAPIAAWAGVRVHF